MTEPKVPLNLCTTNNILNNAPKISGGVGEDLLKKMGWEPGKGLGRNRDGPVEPLTLDVKSDRKGLYSSKDKHSSSRNDKSFGNKNPISLIMEHCSKKGIPTPVFIPSEVGTQPNRRFAILNGVEYIPATGSANKKAAKAQICLIMYQSLGLG